MFKDQVPFATSKALNRMALRFQEDQRDHQRRIFTIRRPRFVDRAVKVKPFSTKRTLFADVSIDPPGGQARADVLTKFEDQTSKSPLRGRSIAVPTDAVPRTGAGIIRKGWRPGELFEGAKQHGRGRAIGSKGDVYHGKKKTILIRKPGGKGFIFQYQGAGSVGTKTGHNSGLVCLYVLVPRVEIRPELDFERNASLTFERHWVEYYVEAFDQAIRTAR